MSVDWSNAPENANYHAFDGYWYNKVPTNSRSSWTSNDDFYISSDCV
jgi:hypothetical protein